MIAFLAVIYTAVVLVLFKVMHIKPTAYLIASLILAGVVMVGGVVVVWSQGAPLTDKMVTSQYVVQLVPYELLDLVLVLRRVNLQEQVA